MNPPQTPIIEGTLFVSSRGVGYVRYDPNEESIEIDHSNLNTGLHGDIVRTRIFPQIAGQQQKGEIMEIIARSKVGFAGVIERDGDLYFLSPSDPKMYTDILIPEKELAGATEGQKVFTVITSWTDSKKSPLGKVIKVLGLPMENNAEMEAIALEKGFAPALPEAPVIEGEQIDAEAHIAGLDDHRVFGSFADFFLVIRRQPGRAADSTLNCRPSNAVWKAPKHSRSHSSYGRVRFATSTSRPPGFSTRRNSA